MGAHAAGELASQLATDNIPHAYHKRRDLPPWESIVAAVEDANSRIHAKGQNSVDFHGMGTTCSCLLLLPDGAVAAHVGDSRVYRLRGTTIEQLTFDHSLVWEMAAAGHASEDDVPAYVPKNVITRSLGPHPTVKVDLEGPLPGACRRSVSAVQRRAHGAAQPAAHRHGARVAAAGRSGANAGRSGQPARRARQHHGRRGRSGDAGCAARKARLRATAAATIGRRGGGRATGHEHVISAAPRRGWRRRRRCSAVAGSIHRRCRGGGRRRRGRGRLVSGGAVTAATLPRQRGSGGSFGKGPYRKYAVEPSAENIEMLSDIVRQLEDLEDQRKWPFDWRRNPRRPRPGPPGHRRGRLHGGGRRLFQRRAAADASSPRQPYRRRRRTPASIWARD